MLVVAFVLVLGFISTLGEIVTIPSGDASSLETYLCNESLTSGTTLLLEGGIHLLSSGPSCDITNLSNVVIVGSSNGITPVVVQCNGERMFRFSAMKNLTIENITFAQCGQTGTVRVRNGRIITSSMVFYLDSSSAVSIRGVTLTRFTGFALVGYGLTKLVMSDVKVFGCSNKNCSGIYLEASSACLFERCQFSNLTFYCTYITSLEYFGSGVTLQGSVARIENSVFTSNQGGSALSAYDSSVHIYNSSFERNIANQGGAISSMDSRLLNISRCTFQENQAKESGGAIYQGPVSQALLLSNCTQSGPLKVVTIDGSVFYDNIATVGGALFMFKLQLNVQVQIRKSAAIKNSADLGAAIYAGNRHKEDSGSTFSVVLEDVAIVNNRGNALGSAVYLSEVDYLSIIGQSNKGSEFIGNSPMGAVQAIGTNVHIRGKVSFTDNSGTKGGALFLTSNSELYFYENSSVQFFGNNATKYGGAIYIQGDRNVALSETLLWCAIHFKVNNYRGNISFFGNHAEKSGHSLYATTIYNCNLEVGPNVLGNGTYEVYYEYFHIVPAPGDSNQTQIMSFPVKVKICSCESYYADGTTAWPGATVRCNVTTLDFENHTSPSVVYTTIEPEDGIASVYTKIGPQQEVQWTGAECTPFEYQVYGLENTMVNLKLFTDQGDTSLRTLVIPVKLGACGPGFKLSVISTNLYTCVCSSFLASFSISCDVNKGTVNITHTIGWIGLTEDRSEAVAATCPLDYCNPSVKEVILEIGRNDLCQGGREGILCGRCPKGMSVVFGSSECRKCSNVWLVTLLMYAVVGVVLIVILFALNLTVTQGTIYGIIFYANIVAVSSTVLFGETNSKFLQVIMSFIILDLGFPMCFYDGMDDATKMGLQFVFPIYLLALTVVFTAICRYCITPQSQNSPTKCRSLLGQLSMFTLQRAVSVIATLIYLSYFKLLRTVIDILSYAIVNIQSGQTAILVNVWFYDGNIPYLSGKHFILFTIAAATAVLFIIPYTVAITVIPIISRFSDNNKVLRWINAKINLIKPMNDAYYAPYKGWCRSWLGVQLFLFIFLLVPSPFLGSNNPSLLMFIHVIVLSIFVFIQAQIKPMDGLLPFRNKKMLSNLHHVYNWLDLFYIMNYTILAFSASYLLSNGGQLGMTVAVLVGSAVFIFLVTILIHLIVSCLKLFKGFDYMTERIESHLQRKIEQSTSFAFSPKESYDEENRLFSASFVNLEGFDLREPLMESERDDNDHAL